jgi:hypothetical protein
MIGRGLILFSLDDLIAKWENVGFYLFYKLGMIKI